MGSLRGPAPPCPAFSSPPARPAPQLATLPQATPSAPGVPKLSAVALSPSSGGLEGPHLDALDVEVGGWSERGVAESGTLLAPALVQVLIKHDPKLALASPNNQVAATALHTNFCSCSLCSHLNEQLVCGGPRVDV